MLLSNCFNIKYHISWLFLCPLFCLAQQKEVNIRIAQDDQSLPLDSIEKRLVLQRKSFKIHVLLNNVEGVYCYASFTDTLFRLSDIDQLPGFDELPNKLLREEDFNKDKEIYIGNEGWGYWFYKAPPASHRFNRKVIRLDGNRVVATKSIKQVYLTSSKKETKLKDISEPLYIFFIAVAESDATGKPLKELMRRKVRIDWIEEETEK